MLGNLLKFELKYHLRQVGFWITVAIMFLMGVLLISTDAITISAGTGERIKANGANTLALQTSVLSLLSIFFGAVFVVSGVMRDHVHKTLEIVHATPITTAHMTLSRMMGVYIATFLCIFAVVLGQFAGQFVPWIDKESLGPIKLVYFLYPALVFIAINTLFVSGFYTAVAAITRNRALVYVSAVGLFVAYTAASLFVGQDAPDWLVSIVDPFGSNALAVTTEFWPSAEQNTRMASLVGYVGINRLVWGGVGLLLYFASFSLFKRGLQARMHKGTLEELPDTKTRIDVSPAPISLTSANTLSAFVTRFKFEYLTTVRSIAFIILALIAVILFATSVFVQMRFLPDPVLPTSAQMASTVIGSLLIPLLIIITFFSGEIIWRDKTAGITEILDASPVRNWPLMAGKWMALIAVVVTMLGGAIIFGMAAQLILGDVAINPVTYLKTAFVSIGPRILFFSVLVLFVQNFVPNRIVGMLIAAALLIFFFFILPNLPFSHPLMTYGIASPGPLSELNGYADLTQFKWFSFYWSMLALLFAIVSMWLWRRGLQNALLARIRGLGKQISMVSIAFATLFLAGFAGSGAMIYKAYNIDGEFRTGKQTEIRAARWEALLGEALNKPTPKIRSVVVDVQFNPSEETAVVKGWYDIENTTGHPLEELYVSLPTRHEENVHGLTLTGAVQDKNGENIDEVRGFGYRIYRFTTPLQSGERTRLSFDISFHAPRLGDGGQIRRNGTFVNNFQVMPQIEIQDGRLTNPDTRRKYDLPEYEKRAARTDKIARQNNFITRSADYVNFKATVCTDKGQIPIAPGKLLRAYEKGEKACRDYEAINPILNFFSFLSADYAVKKDVWENPNTAVEQNIAAGRPTVSETGQDVALEVFYHGEHDYNIDLMIEAMKMSLDTFTKTFGPYQYSQIRIMEFPYAPFAQAFAGTIPFSENIGFARNPGDPDDNESVDLATYVTMHEIGHQWFAHQIVPANTRGFNVLSEGLTENAAMTAYEDALGWQKARRLLEQRSIQAYLTGRAVDRDDEPPLAKAGNQQYIVYNKASWVFWGLKQYMGEDVMQAAIRGFLEDYGTKGPLYPTTKELVDALRAAAPAHLQGLITDYWDRIAFWQLKFSEPPTVSGDEANGYTLSFTANVDKKIASEESGEETSVTEIENETLNEWVEIGFYTSDPKDTLGDEWVKLERVNITQLDTEFTFTLDVRPTHVLLDPRRLLIERNIDDNVAKINP